MRNAIVLLLFGCLVSSAAAKVELSGLFVEGMVVQRDRPIPVWGWATAGESVTVHFAAQQRAATADARGRWQVEFAAMQAGGPHTLEVEAGEKLTVNDAWVGEVWICSGQSNMAFEMAGVRDARKEMAEANFPQIRMWHMKYGITLEPQERCVSLDGKWVACTPATVGPFSAVGYYFAREIQRTLGVPIGMIHTSWGATSAAQWTSEEALAAEPTLKPVMDFKRKVIDDYVRGILKLIPELQAWKVEAEDALAKGASPRLPSLQQQLPADPLNLYTHMPTGVFNVMLNPITSCSVRGVIWYQGEQDSSQAKSYRTGFPAMIRDWRKRFANPDLPFLYAQICTINAPGEQPPERSAWAELRETQTACLDVPHTAMAVTVDLGEPNDPHPRNKLDAGKRLALAARATVYGEKLVYQGPTYKGMQIENEKIRVTFDHVHGGLTTRNNEAPQGFAVAGEDKKFAWAKAQIKGNDVIVWSEKVAKPAAVRYAWEDMPRCNLYNKEGLPAVPFRSHPW